MSKLSGWSLFGLALIVLWLIPLDLSLIGTMPSERLHLKELITEANQEYAKLQKNSDTIYSQCIMPLHGKANVQLCKHEQERRNTGLIVDYTNLKKRISELQKKAKDGQYADEVHAKQMAWLKNAAWKFLLSIALMATAIKMLKMLVEFLLRSDNRLVWFLKTQVSDSAVLGLAFVFWLVTPIGFLGVMTLDRFYMRSGYLSIEQSIIELLFLGCSIFVAKSYPPKSRLAVISLRVMQALALLFLVSQFAFATERTAASFPYLIFLVFILVWLITGKHKKYAVVTGVLLALVSLVPIDVWVVPSHTVSDEKEPMLEVLQTSYGLASGPAPEGFINMGCVVPVNPPSYLLAINIWPALGHVNSSVDLVKGL